MKIVICCKEKPNNIKKQTQNISSKPEGQGIIFLKSDISTEI